MSIDMVGCMDVDTVSPRMVTALDDAWAAIRTRHPEALEVVVTLGAGTDGRGTARHGHYAARRWVRGEDEMAELFVSGEGLARGARAVLGTLLHEAAHGVADTRGVADTSRQGRFHNTRFRAIAGELGLMADKTDGLGWPQPPCRIPPPRCMRARSRRSQRH